MHSNIESTTILGPNPLYLKQIPFRITFQSADINDIALTKGDLGPPKAQNPRTHKLSCGRLTKNARVQAQACSRILWFTRAPTRAPANSGLTSLNPHYLRGPSGPA